MAYAVNKTDGTLLVTVADGTLNTSASSISLLGKNFAGYGEVMAETLIHMLEHFNNTTSPTNPLAGQVWFDRSVSDGKLNVFNTAGVWTPIGSVFSSANPPSSPVEGDLWWNLTSNKLFAYDGPSTTWINVGPAGGADTISGDSKYVHLVINAGGTGGQVTTTQAAAPTGGTETDALGLVVESTLIGLWTNDAVASPTYYYDPTYIDGTDVQYYAFAPFAAEILKGANTGLDASGFWFNGKARSALTADAITGIAVADIMLNQTGAPAQTSREPVAGSLDIGAVGNRWDIIFATTFNGTATAAQYSDVAERYHADAILEPGDVVRLGGINEITKTTQSLDDEVFGVISTNPALRMNDGAGNDDTHPHVSFIGRIPCKITGPISKGDRIISSEIPGIAMSSAKIPATGFMIIGRALEDKTTEGIGLVEVVVGVK